MNCSHKCAILIKVGTLSSKGQWACHSSDHSAWKIPLEGRARVCSPWLGRGKTQPQLIHFSITCIKREWKPIPVFLKPVENPGTGAWGGPLIQVPWQIDMTEVTSGQQQQRKTAQKFDEHCDTDYKMVVTIHFRVHWETKTLMTYL